MEGDEHTYIDGSRYPQVHGNGTEDDFNQGWGGSPVQEPLWGALRTGYSDAWRLYPFDPYVFFDNIRIYTEGGGIIACATWYYLAKPGTSELKQTDELDVGNAESERAHQYTVSSETWSRKMKDYFPGFDASAALCDPCEDDGRGFTGASEFTLAIHPVNMGVRLRRRLNTKDNGVQVAKVFVDGRELPRPWLTVGPWGLEPIRDQKGRIFDAQCWQESDYEIPAGFTAGKSKLRIRVQAMDHPPVKTPDVPKEINEFRYWAFTHVKGETP
jgi:hypothetical protein